MYAYALCLNAHRQFNDFSGINLISLNLLFLFILATYFLYMLLLSHKEHSIYVNKDWQVERTVQHIIPPFF